MKIAMICVMLAATSCGYIRQQLKGDPGEFGEDGRPGLNGENGEEGEDGNDGADGSSGSDGNDGFTGPVGSPGEDGRDGERGPRGYPGNIDDIVDRYYNCSARYDLSSYKWYNLRLDVYVLSTGEYYLYGRSDLFGNNDFFRPDSGSSYTGSVSTATFDYELVSGNQWKWTHARSQNSGQFKCHATTD